MMKIADKSGCRKAVSVGPPLLALLTTALFSLSCQGPAGPKGDDAVLADSLPPVIEWISPAAGIQVSGMVTLKAAAYDDQGIYRVAFFVSGFEFAGRLTNPDSGFYSADWDATLYPEGPYPLAAMVWDNSRLLGTAPERLVWVKH